MGVKRFLPKSVQLHEHRIGFWKNVNACGPACSARQAGWPLDGSQSADASCLAVT